MSTFAEWGFISRSVWKSCSPKCCTCARARFPARIQFSAYVCWNPICYRHNQRKAINPIARKKEQLQELLGKIVQAFSLVVFLPSSCPHRSFTTSAAGRGWVIPSMMILLPLIEAVVDLGRSCCLRFAGRPPHFSMQPS